MSRTIRSRLLRVPDVSKVEILGAQDEQIYHRVLDGEARRPRASIAPTLIAALRAQNAVSPAGTLQTGDEKLALRVSGAFELRAGHPRRQYRRRTAG